jgi:uncharacterized protein YbcC (UPF0753/DUF2309 family)
MHPGDTAGTDDPVAAGLAAARAILPDQGPLGVFIHHNTLHALQHLSFHDAVQRGAAMLGARPYLDIDAYRAAYRAGRIEAEDLGHALAARAATPRAEPVAAGLTGDDLRRLCMLFEPERPDVAGVEFRLRNGLLAAGSAACYRACVAAVSRCAPAEHAPASPTWRRHRDALLALGGADVDLTVSRELVRLSAAYLDQGQILSPMPHRGRGFLLAVARLYADSASAPRGATQINDDFAGLAGTPTHAASVIRASLDALGVPEDDIAQYVLEMATALAGWAGMFARIESHPEEGRGCPASLADYLAVRVVLERRAVEQEASRLRLPVDLRALRARRTPEPDAKAAGAAVRLWALAEGAGMSAAAVDALSAGEIAHIWRESDRFTMLERRAIWQEAYEGWYRRQILDAMAARRKAGLIAPTERPAAQFLFCIDEREESIRRGLEEQGTQFETLGGAGFFGIAIDYQGLYDAEPTAHCPVVVTPDHEVYEAPLYTAHGWHLRRQRLRNAWNRAHRAAHSRSRTLTGGAGLSFLLGPLAVLAAVTRVLMPRRSLDLVERVGDRLFPRPATRLSALRGTPPGTRSERGKLPGFSLEEATDRVAGFLRATGLSERMAPIVIILGHGSTSLNNPHESAHDCGACGGRRGGANARLFADIANQSEVRAALRQRGILIPADTWFVGALHDTANDAVHYYDLEQLPLASRAAFETADRALETARQRSAQERCRRFHNAPLGLSPEAALRHVEARASHFGQPRPEYGHCTNAIAVVGRRRLTRGIHLDRRPFLVSYDPDIDGDGGLIERVLAAVGPVGAGINLEYYFSSVDNERYGCGTKLPHNVTGLIGIMNGHFSDLRTGLPLQMVELHEPMRLLLIVEASPATLLQVASRQAEVRELVVNEWVQLVSVDPASGEMQVFERGAFRPYVPTRQEFPRVGCSQDWHGGAREHLRPALIDARVPAPAPARVPAERSGAIA